MSFHTVTIEGMSGDACVQRILAALSEIDGVAVKSMGVGSTVLECDHPMGLECAQSAIVSAGFGATVHQGEPNTDLTDRPAQSAEGDSAPTPESKKTSVIRDPTREEQQVSPVKNSSRTSPSDPPQTGRTQGRSL